MNVNLSWLYGNSYNTKCFKHVGSCSYKQVWFVLLLGDCGLFEDSENRFVLPNYNWHVEPCYWVHIYGIQPYEAVVEDTAVVGERFGFDAMIELPENAYGRQEPMQFELELNGESTYIRILQVGEWVEPESIEYYSCGLDVGTRLDSGRIWESVSGIAKVDLKFLEADNPKRCYKGKHEYIYSSIIEFREIELKNGEHDNAKVNTFGPFTAIVGQDPCF